MPKLDYGTVVYTTPNDTIAVDYCGQQRLGESLQCFKEKHLHENYFVSIFSGCGYYMGQEPIITKKITNI